MPSTKRPGLKIPARIELFFHGTHQPAAGQRIPDRHRPFPGRRTALDDDTTLTLAGQLPPRAQQQGGLLQSLIRAYVALDNAVARVGAQRACLRQDSVRPAKLRQRARQQHGLEDEVRVGPQVPLSQRLPERRRGETDPCAPELRRAADFADQLLDLPLDGFRVSLETDNQGPRRIRPGHTGAG